MCLGINGAIRKSTTITLETVLFIQPMETLNKADLSALMIISSGHSKVTLT